MKEIVVPDIGTTDPVDVVEILVSVGDTVTRNQSLITVESSKASMEIPSAEAGIIKEIKVTKGSKIQQGQVILLLESTAEAAIATKQTATSIAAAPTNPAPVVSAPSIPAPTAQPVVSNVPAAASGEYYAGPGVRRLARELGVDLSRVPSTGNKGRIIKEDVVAFVKEVMQKGAGSMRGGLAVAPLPEIDFAKFGPIESVSLTKIKKLTSINLSRNWLMAPHVTQFAKADITSLEQFRKQHADKATQQGFKLTLLVFIMKAAVKALQDFPQFNASLSNDGEKLIVKKYYHIGVAVDTPNGLVVPVVRDVDQKGLLQIAKELSVISRKAREVGLSLGEMQGSTFTISSLGGIGGTAFTPIINLPDVAILGVSASSIEAEYCETSSQFKPRLKLPLSLSYDHRVIDGAEGARFIVALSGYLSDLRLLSL